MADDAKKQDQLLETTDCLEAISTLKSTKNLFFFICLVCLLLLQASFWLMATKHINYNDANHPSAEADVHNVTILPAANVEPNSTKDPNAVWHKYTKQIATAKIDFNTLSWVIRVSNYLLIISSVMYAMSLLFGLMISLVGRLGGISHVTKAFFISLLFIVVLMPWQSLFRNIGIGAIFKPSDLLASWQLAPDMDTLEKVFRLYAKYAGWGILSILLLLWAQLKSIRWSRNTLKRLGIVG